jgi:hypothetical protein
VNGCALFIALFASLRFLRKPAPARTSPTAKITRLSRVIPIRISFDIGYPDSTLRPPVQLRFFMSGDPFCVEKLQLSIVSGESVRHGSINWKKEAGRA